jgi:hypothetical protein
MLASLLLIRERCLGSLNPLDVAILLLYLPLALLMLPVAIRPPALQTQLPFQTVRMKMMIAFPRY